jgi:uncharacterized damage-inducible protein DinB
MNKKMLSIFNELEINRQSLFNTLDSINHDLHDFRPDPQSWSILQVCHHLIVSEELSLKYLNKKLKYKTNIPPAGIRSSLSSFSLNLALRLPFRLSAPQRVSEFPEDLEWKDLKNRWSKVREGIKKRLTTIPDEFKNKLVYKHPAAGRLTLYQMLTFFKIHINRHEGQILRLIQTHSDSERRNP